MSEELTHSQMQKIGEEVVGVLCNIFDPEIPVDIYQLGLIYDVQVSTRVRFWGILPFVVFPLTELINTKDYVRIYKYKWQKNAYKIWF